VWRKPGGNLLSCLCSKTIKSLVRLAVSYLHMFWSKQNFLAKLGWDKEVSERERERERDEPSGSIKVIISPKLPSNTHTKVIRKLSSSEKFPSSSFSDCCPSPPHPKRQLTAFSSRIISSRHPHPASLYCHKTNCALSQSECNEKRRRESRKKENDINTSATITLSEFHCRYAGKLSRKLSYAHLTF